MREAVCEGSGVWGRRCGGRWCVREAVCGRGGVWGGGVGGGVWGRWCGGGGVGEVVCKGGSVGGRWCVREAVCDVKRLHVILQFTTTYIGMLQVYLIRTRICLKIHETVSTRKCKKILYHFRMLVC